MTIWSRPLALTVAGSTALGLLLVWRKSLRWRSQAAECLPADPLWAEYKLSAEDVELFGRQVVLPKLGVEGQLALSEASALIVGAGGLGCPVALYVCAAGVGRIGLVDDDIVSVSNLHRQIGHAWRSKGEHKATSLRRACLSVRPSSHIDAYPWRLGDVDAAAELIRGFDVVVDCTDSPTSRYLLNDAAVAAGKPLIAASSVGLSGQLTVYNLDGGPCLRCVYPTQPGSDAAEAVGSCEEQGVLGPICGIIGTLAALEVVKVLSRSALRKSCLNGRMLLYDAMDETPVRTMRIKRKTGCIGCGEDAGGLPTIRKHVCGCLTLPAVPTIAAADLRQRLLGKENLVVVDVRQAPHFAVSHLAGAVSWPLQPMLKVQGEALREKLVSLSAATPGSPVVCVCRRGNDSARAAEHLQKAGIEAWNLGGGLQALQGLTVKRQHQLPPLT